MKSVLIWLGLTVLVSAVQAESEDVVDPLVTEDAWFDIEVENLEDGVDYNGRITIALFGDITPMTVLNFAAITKGFRKGNETLHYKNTTIHRVVTDFVVQMGDVTVGDGTGGKSIYGKHFDDENFVLSHKSAGWVSMANHGKDTNGSQFFIVLNPARWLDQSHVVFGKVIEGFDVLEILGELKTDPKTAVPLKKVTIVDCGVIKGQKTHPYRLSEKESS